jgi:hypothetical protein
VRLFDRAGFATVAVTARVAAICAISDHLLFRAWSHRSPETAGVATKEHGKLVLRISTNSHRLRTLGQQLVHPNKLGQIVRLILNLAKIRHQESVRSGFNDKSI